MFLHHWSYFQERFPLVTENGSFWVRENTGSSLLLHIEGDPPRYVEAPVSFITMNSCSPHPTTRLEDCLV